MPKEIELTVYDIDREEVIKKLEECKAVFVGKYHFKTVNFQLETKGTINSLKLAKRMKSITQHGLEYAQMEKEQR